MNSVRSWFKIFLSLPQTGYIGQTFALGVQSMRCLGILFHVSKISGEAGENIELAADVEPLKLLDCILEKVKSAIDVLGVDEDSHLFRFHELFRQMRHIWALEFSGNAGITTDIQLPTDTSNTLNGSITLPSGSAIPAPRRYEADIAEFPDFDLFDSEFLLGWPPMNL